MRTSLLTACKQPSWITCSGRRLRNECWPKIMSACRIEPCHRNVASHRTIMTTSGGDNGAGRTLTIALCFAVAVLEGFDIQALGVATPRLAPEFGLTADRMGWVFAVSNIGLLIGASLGGWLADRFGRKPVFIVAVATFGAFTLATPLIT